MLETNRHSIDLSALSFWASPAAERDEAFRALRDSAPVTWQRQAEGSLLPAQEGTGGYWAVVRHADVRAVSRDAATFSAGHGVVFEDAPAELLEGSQSILAMDDPRHMKLRKLVSSAFTPRHVTQLESHIGADARTIVDQLDEDGDFVQAVAKRLPLMTIMRMIGVPAEDRERLADAADALVSWNDDEFLAGREPLAVLGSAMFELQHAAAEIAAQRQREPQDDLISALVHAEIDGERLTRQEIAAFFVLLSVAGNDTTRHTTSHGMRALCDFREQRTYLQNDLAGRLPLAVEELVRWATPIMTFRRTATRDTEIAGTAIRDGQKVVMFYSSANRDERAFANPDHLDLARDPNRHVGFGGGGPHFCLGASIARCQLRAIFTELLTTYPNIEVGEPCRTVGNFVNAVASMPMQPGPRSKLTCEPT